MTLTSIRYKTDVNIKKASLRKECKDAFYDKCKQGVTIRSACISQPVGVSAQYRRNS